MFSHVEASNVYRVILSLNPQNSVSKSIPINILQLTAEVICTPLADHINTSKSNSVFPDAPKLAEVCPVFKKGDKFLKENIVLFLVFYHPFQKSIIEYSSSQNISKICFQVLLMWFSPETQHTACLTSDVGILV